MARDPSPSVAPLDGSATERSEVDGLISRVRLANGHAALSDGALLSWRSQASARRAVARRSGQVVGFAQVDRHGASASIELAVDPAEPDPAGTRRHLLEWALTGEDAAEIRYWVTQHEEGDGNEALEFGFHPERDLLQLRVPLPLTLDRPDPPPGFSLRPFRPGRDEQDWLEVNNRAFATHPEQGDWTLEELVARERADWFDPEGFLLCEQDGRLAGSCWTKLHRDEVPVLGEIYVISVDPDFQGLGLGRLLAVAGLDRLSTDAPFGMLYVDRSNVGAVALYRKLGFILDHVDRCYLLAEGRRGATAQAPVPSPTPRPIP
jgi:mycothiol synthase